MSGGGVYNLLNDNGYGTFVAYCLALLSGIALVSCLLKVTLKTYCGIDICTGVVHHQNNENQNQHQRRRLSSSVHRERGTGGPPDARAEQEAADAAMAERMQREMLEEDRTRIVAQKRKVRRGKMEVLLKDVTMTVRKEDLDRNHLDPESGLPEVTVRIPSASARSTDTDSDPSVHSDASSNGDGADATSIAAAAGRRVVPAHCAVCLAAYDIGDRLVWSPNYPRCQHVFHEECILNWLSRGKKKRCPCCRTVFAGAGAGTGAGAPAGEVEGGEAATTVATSVVAAAATGREGVSEAAEGDVAVTSVAPSVPATPTRRWPSSEHDSLRRLAEESPFADEEDAVAVDAEGDYYSDEDDDDEEAEAAADTYEEEAETDEDYLLRARRRRRSRTRGGGGAEDVALEVETAVMAATAIAAPSPSPAPSARSGGGHVGGGPFASPTRSRGVEGSMLSPRSLSCDAEAEQEQERRGGGDRICRTSRSNSASSSSSSCGGEDDQSSSASACGGGDKDDTDV